MSRYAVNLCNALFSVCLLAALLGVPATHAQQARESEAPVVIHRPSDLPGVAGELQTFSARVYADLGLSSVVLYHRTGSAEYRGINMRLLYDSFNEYMIALETSAGSAPIEYFIVATDSGGNLTFRGDQNNPLRLELRPAAPGSAITSTLPEAPQPRPSGTPVPPLEQERPAAGALLLGVGALVLLGALAAGGGDSGGSDETITLTIFSPDPSGN